ncbi:flagellar hook-associated protein FlgK [Paracoccus sp. P2]|uniref:Flagellar hook-associated protein 1 n=2 Tax=Paracoccus pantotrophus TaxID=82367 RepID=A0A1I5BDA3_PARPN|nr:flagellar hook-associated protein FlgK [Paracoccus pantotrophus]MDF3852770.1 flagellar hook-associated protein FlgK [Paracoccus pantotrophus]QFG36718.1 flagellar hook-associated protein FlgK [Paracoccus pantotrophus]QLH14281.1 flagellar hook-associated protein FlgK [Paracoccus pantotrophus]RDD96561.1 flagellar hook-associated protein FlgK [Paracoccus pantotrophus]RKS52883.1 flagellar hook-associated protein 1 FlgK [Paracoccus pantotrophus]
MSLSSAISNAVSGLTAASRGTEVVSSNIANALTPGYGRRELDLSSRLAERGGGVSIDGVSRTVTAGLIADNRLALADVGSTRTVAAFHATMEQAFGTGTEASSLVQTLTDFESALTRAAARPDSEARLATVLDTATVLANKVNGISATIQAERGKAEQAIKNDVSRLNTALEQVAKLNAQIVTVTAQGKDASSLMDARQAIIDSVSDIVPIKEVPRENGRVALFTSGGAILLDGTEPARIGFDAVSGITVDMTAASGALSALTLNGKPLGDPQKTMWNGGSLEANFVIRDQIAPAYQQQIDAFARDLYDRLSDPAIDPSLNPGDPGLFTDSQGAFSSADETGFASRIAVNRAANPETGGQLWRIRAGINAIDPGSSGESALLDRLGMAISTTRSPASASLSDAPRGLQGLSADLSSAVATNRIRAEASAMQSSSRQSGLQSALLAEGVDSDKEMESLLALERAYAANAKVFQTANDMLDTILRLT